MTAFTYAALQQPVSIRQSIRQPGGWAISVCAIGAFAIVTLAIVTAFLLQSPTMFVVYFFFALFLGAIGLSAHTTIRRHVRLQAFAAQNNLTYIADQAYNGRPGVIFGEGDSRIFVDLLQTNSQPFIEIGNYRYTIGSGKNRHDVNFGFVRVKLPRRLPNMVLDAHSNNFLGRFSNLPAGLSGNQKLALEGDFNNYFTLYAPADYGRDALYVFTPDVMQALVDAAHKYDCEVIDDDFYIYSSGQIDLTDQTRIEELLGVIKVIQPELVEQTDYYADERVGSRAANLIAEPGARLKTRMPAIGIIAVSLVFTYILINSAIPMISTFIDAFSRSS
jgi:hypothetical protein